MHKAQLLGRKQIRTPAAVFEDAQLDVDLLRQQHTRVVVLLVDARALFVCVLGLCVSKASTTLARSIHPSPTRTYIHTSKHQTNQHKHKKTHQREKAEEEEGGDAAPDQQFPMHQLRQEALLVEPRAALAAFGGEHLWCVANVCIWR